MSVSQLEKDRAALWRAGKLRWTLHKGQKQLYDHYRAWEKHAFEERKAGRTLPGMFPRIYNISASRRWGKDRYSLTTRIEDCIRKPGGRYTYATALGKDVSSIVVPLVEDIIETAPLDVKPVYKQAFQGTEAGFFFPNGSVLLLVGIDRNPDGLRGRYSDGITISEAEFVDRIEYGVLSVLMPQLQGRLDATIVLNSTPAEAPGLWIETTVIPDCIEHGRYFTRTIEDNPMLSESEREEFIRAAGGRESERCRREYYVERIRSNDLVVLPEFSEERHVKSSPIPKYALGFTVLDPGVRDLCAAITGYLDFERRKLVVKKCWAKRNAPTTEVADAIRTMEAEVFGPPESKDALTYWGTNVAKQNPFQRYSDTEARLIMDLSVLHGLKVAAADKVDREAALNALRVALQTGQIEIDPDCKDLISHCKAAIWNKSRTSFERNPIYGHYDLVDALLYAWRMMNPSFRINPVPPIGWQAIIAGKPTHNTLWRPGDWKHLNSVTDKLAQILPKRRKSHTR